MLSQCGNHDAMGTDYKAPPPSNCPECGQALAQGEKSCWLCGWGAPPELQGVPG